MTLSAADHPTRWGLHVVDVSVTKSPTSRGFSASSLDDGFFEKLGIYLWPQGSHR